MTESQESPSVRPDQVDTSNDLATPTSQSSSPGPLPVREGFFQVLPDGSKLLATRGGLRLLLPGISPKRYRQGV